MRKAKRYISALVSIVLIGSLLTGCSMTDSLVDKLSSSIDPTKTISKDSKWINSDLVGAVTESTDVSEKDDFTTAVNKEWMLSVQDKAKKEGSVSRIQQNAEEVQKQKQNLLELATEGKTYSENRTEMDAASYEHVTNLFSTLVSEAADWNTRDEEDIKPVEKYIDTIRNINSLEEMNQYLINENGTCFSLSYLIPFSVSESMDESKKYTVDLTSGFDDSMTVLQSDGDQNTQNAYVMEVVTDTLGKMGYSSSDAKKIVTQCWRLETQLEDYSLADDLEDTSVDLEKLFNNQFSLKEVQEMSGEYPLTDILKEYQYDQSDSYTVYEPDYIKGVAKLYKEKNLDEIKSYYIVHTILKAMPLLSRDSYNKYQDYFTDYKEQDKNSTETDSDDTTTGEDTTEDNKDKQEQTKAEQLEGLSEDQKTLQMFVMNNFNGLFEEVYVLNYCSAEQKEYIRNIIKDAVAVYKDMLTTEDWLSKETQQKAIEKLDNMGTQVLYPDHMDTYEKLQLNGDNLVDDMSALYKYQLMKDAEKINTKEDRSTWDLEQMPTTTVNAYYYSGKNSITILAGIIADKELFNVDASYEENLAHLGFIIGHEISHAFDSNGYRYDKDGNEKKWWTKEDEQKFQERVAKLANYFSSFPTYSGSSTNVDGEKIQEEAIADMGGLKCMITLGKKQTGFDYQKFFHSYAETFATVNKMSAEMISFNHDSHPLPFLRINVTVQQFEEFYQTFDIQPGDGMYLAPENRVAVW